MCHGKMPVAHLFFRKKHPVVQIFTDLMLKENVIIRKRFLPSVGMTSVLAKA